IQSRGGLCFALETGESLRIGGETFRKKLQGHKTVEANVLGLVHHIHPATAELLAVVMVWPIMMLGVRWSKSMQSSLMQQEDHSHAHFNFAYSSLASFRMGMSGSASFRWRRNEEQAP